MMMQSAPRLLLRDTLDRSVFAGRKAGEADRGRIEKAARAAAVDGRVVIDLTGVEMLSSSYFDAAIWWLSTLTPELYVALANVPTAGLDDIEIVMKSCAAAIWCFRKPASDRGSLVGALDPVLMTTLELLQARGEASAAELSDADRSIVPTAWNNRLSALHDIRLLRRRKDGRRFIYELAWKER